MNAKFVDRKNCITCGSTNLNTLAEGKFTEDPLYSYLKDDPWGISPLPFIEKENWNFVQCMDCSQKFHKRILDNDWLKIYYSEWISSDAIDEFHRNRGGYDNFNKARKNVERVLLIEKSTREIRQNQSLRILDFGCGDGDFLSCCEMFGFKSVGVEFSKSRSQRRKIDFYPSLKDVIDELGTDFKFDAVTMFEVLEHLPDPLKTLKELSVCLKKRGVFILETPNCINVSGIRTKDDYRKIHPLGHINAFTPITMKKIAYEAGLDYFSPGTPQVFADFKRVMKREVRRLVSHFSSPSTQMYFRKT